MKKYVVLITATFFLSAISNPIQAQRKNFIPEKGFWQLVSNVHIKKNTQVQFYDDSLRLIYEETVTGVRMNVKRKKTLQSLKAGLEKAIIAWNETKVPSYNGGMLAGIIKGK